VSAALRGAMGGAQIGCDPPLSTTTAARGNPGEWTLTADNAGLIRETVATNLRRARDLHGMSHRTLALRSGLIPGSVARIEGSQTEPRISTLVTIAIALRAPLPSLLKGLPSAVPGPNEHSWVGDSRLAAIWTLSPDNLRLLRAILGANLRRERKLLGITQQTLAGISHVGEDTIIRSERAHQEPKLSTVVAWSFGLSVPFLSLLAGLPSTRGSARTASRACL
jgi:transcriptional regulator with XRE-family HTH domain